MSETTEFEIKVSGLRITNASVQILKQGTCKLILETEAIPNQEIKNNKESFNDIFSLVQASKLSLDDDFMKHDPRTLSEENLKNLIEEAIRNKTGDFYRPKMDPSFDDKGGICYKAGNMPAVGKSYSWWQRMAKAYMPERKSRLGNKLEYAAFLGVLIKKLVKQGWDISKAWSAVCNDSKELGHYANSENARRMVEPTGSREVCGFCELANTYKYLAGSSNGNKFWKAGANYASNSMFMPISDLLVFASEQNHDWHDSVGWIVIPKIRKL